MSELDGMLNFLDSVYPGPTLADLQAAWKAADEACKAQYPYYAAMLPDPTAEAQRILRAHHNDRIERVWSETLGMHVRIGERA